MSKRIRQPQNPANKRDRGNGYDKIYSESYKTE